ncbi:MAG: PHP domain-containing protein [Proteobacteria bacterium]|nr:PHP domain-containing protein [Pseudomonadota bacterium]
MIDLHIHTNASSDGQHSPREIFAMAREKGLRAIAFADHNSVANVEEGLRLAGEFGIELIPCMELNTFHNGLDLHLLTFYIQPRHQALRDWLKSIHQKKKEQAEKRVLKLNELGFIFDWNDLGKFSADRIPTGMSFLQAILSRKENLSDLRLKPYIDGQRSNSPYVNFYRDYLRGGKPAFVHMEDIYTIDAIRKIKDLGGIAVLAHPSDTEEENLKQLVENGLEGLEVYSPYHNAQEQEAFRIFALKHNLLITAGSDFHGKRIKPDVELGEVAGNHYQLLDQLKKHRKENR